MQNMILAVGPGTPATTISLGAPGALSSSVSGSSSSEEWSSSESVSESARDLSPERDKQVGEDVVETKCAGIDREVRGEPVPTQARRSRRLTEGENEQGSESHSRRSVENDLLEWYDGDSPDEEESDEEVAAEGAFPFAPVPSMRHGGCINTAAWLDCGWRLSTVGSSCHSLPSEECPSQLVTSGDDHVVKFWDVRAAMGMSSPLPGGYDTICPFSAPTCEPQDGIRSTWLNHYKRTRQSACGSVIPLATLHTGHRGNVFHVTPLRGHPGRVVTCGADGYLRLSDLESGNATIVVSPEYEDDLSGLLPAGLLSLRPSMAFSHHFLNSNVGLLCSERGLRLFDLRIPAREQSTQSILGGPFRACKACAIWSSSTASSSWDDGDSAYIFGKWKYASAEAE